MSAGRDLVHGIRVGNSFRGAVLQTGRLKKGVHNAVVSMDSVTVAPTSHLMIT